MYTDDTNDDSQEQTQSTQQASQPLNTELDGHLWGYLQPCSSALRRIDSSPLHDRKEHPREPGRKLIHMVAGLVLELVEGGNLLEHILTHKGILKFLFGS